MWWNNRLFRYVKCLNLYANFWSSEVSHVEKEADIYSIRRIRNKDDRMDVKLYHDRKSSKKDVYWVMKVTILIYRNSKELR